MKKSSRRGLLLFAGAMAVCAFVLPPVASASSWGPIGTHHTLDSPNFGYTSQIGANGVSSSCTASSFTARVLSAGDLSISTGTFGGLCTASGAAIGDCTITTQATGFPWRATAVSTSNIQIHGIDIDYTFENSPGGFCNLAGTKTTITGTLTGGRWTGNTSDPRIDFSNAEGLVTHSVLGNGNPITIRGLFTDTNTASPLTVTG